MDVASQTAWRNSPLSSACLPAFTVETPIHSLMSCVHLFLGLPLPLLPSHVPSKNSFSNVLCHLMWPKETYKDYKNLLAMCYSYAAFFFLFVFVFFCFCFFLGGGVVIPPFLPIPLLLLLHLLLLVILHVFIALLLSSSLLISSSSPSRVLYT